MITKTLPDGPAPGPTAITEARALKAAALQARIKRDVDSWPPLSDSVRADLAILLLHPGIGGGDAPAA